MKIGQPVCCGEPTPVPSAVDSLEILVAGAPNTGKTTIFNLLTGYYGRVANYPGATVETLRARANINGLRARVTDLPGAYSLSVSSEEETLARRELLAEDGAVVVNVVDASHLERNLFFTVQLLELGLNVVLCLNMIDRAREAGLKIDTSLLSRTLHVPVVEVCGKTGEGLSNLKAAIVSASSNADIKPTTIDYGGEIETAISRISGILARESEDNPSDGVDAPAVRPDLLVSCKKTRWLASALLAGDDDVADALRNIALFDEIEPIVEEARAQIGGSASLQQVLDEHRYAFIKQFIGDVEEKPAEKRRHIGDLLDSVIMNPLTGIPLFLAVMWLLFVVVFVAASPITEGLEWLISAIVDLLSGRLGGGKLEALVVDGVIGGVGNVFVFVPSIFLLFAGLALFEDSGYLPRAAFIMERTMSRFGLPGKAFIPFMLGFGCNVPAIMATRVVEDRRDRRIAILVIPFLTCSARLTVYILIAGALCEPRVAGTAIFAVYVLSVVTALAASTILRKLLFKGVASPMILEIPRYSVPSAKGVLTHAWRHSMHYVRKAGTFILAGSMILWFTLNFPVTIGDAEINRRIADATAVYRSRLAASPRILQPMYARLILATDDAVRATAVKTNVEQSIAGRIGKVIEPALRPLGFDWRIGVGLLAGILAKEIVNATLGVIYSSSMDVDDTTLRQAIRSIRKPDGSPLYTPLTAVSLMIFVLLYVPCVATLAVQKKELGSASWFIFASTYTTAVAYLVSLVVYQAGKAVGFP